MDVALKLLRHVEFYKQPRVIEELRVLHQTLQQINNSQREMKFCALGAQAAKSGESLLYKYKVANRLSEDVFLHKTDLPEFIDRKDLMLVFIDDLIGTGDEAIEAWEDVQGVINEENPVYLAVLCATEEGIRRVDDETRGRVSVVSNTSLLDDRKMFSDFNFAFTPQEKAILRTYCQKAGSEPEGYGGCQLAVIFYYRAPDNCISILRSNNEWKGLFPRNP